MTSWITHRAIRAVTVAGAVCVLAACGGPKSDTGTDKYSSTPLTVTPCMSGALNLSVWSLPQVPAAATLMRLKFQAAASDGAPVSGLGIAVEPWMPTMRHGSPVVPEVSDVGDGVYDITNVDFTMVGAWQLLLTISGPMSGSCTIDLNVAPSSS